MSSPTGVHDLRHRAADRDAGIDVAPAHIDLASTEGELFTALGREQILRESLEGQTDVYDYVSSTARPTSGC
jgi:cellulose biosynthesis protein BcsQ